MLRAGKVELCRFPSKNVSPFQSKLRVRNVSTCPPNPVRQYLWLRRCLCHKNRLKNQSKCLFQNMPLFQCYKKPRKVCQTLVTTKPKVVTEQASEIRNILHSSSRKKTKLHAGTSRGVRTLCLEDKTRQKAKSTKADRKTEAFTKKGKTRAGLYQSRHIFFSRSSPCFPVVFGHD